ncbi:unnamed protein product [Cylicocyclus nassatus]|uniref:Uncharacterized protein n=1 Tax=Cylicocyclus nassatus TaxID=53992 RepID=A0AA36M464_CYLNA|nr:unnamed protein product [Cylicocyclus nassatus]
MTKLYGLNAIRNQILPLDEAYYVVMDLSVLGSMGSQSGERDLFAEIVERLKREENYETLFQGRCDANRLEDLLNGVRPPQEITWTDTIKARLYAGSRYKTGRLTAPVTFNSGATVLTSNEHCFIEKDTHIPKESAE